MRQQVNKTRGRVEAAAVVVVVDNEGGRHALLAGESPGQFAVSHTEQQGDDRRPKWSALSCTLGRHWPVESGLACRGGRWSPPLKLHRIDQRRDTEAGA